MESGVVMSGVMESGVVESGVVESGVVESRVVESGVFQLKYEQVCEMGTVLLGGCGSPAHYS